MIYEKRVEIRKRESCQAKDPQLNELVAIVEEGEETCSCCQTRI